MNPARYQTAATLRFVNAGSEYQSLPAMELVPGAENPAEREDAFLYANYPVRDLFG
jgi:hypothetical protein